MVVMSGDVVTSSETLVTQVYSNAMFSDIKYIEPAQRPQDINSSSSRKEFAQSRLWQAIRMRRYARTKRQMYISAGPNPFSSSTLVDTNDTPHAVTVIKAPIWAKKEPLFLLFPSCDMSYLMFKIFHTKVVNISNLTTFFVAENKKMFLYL